MQLEDAIDMLNSVNRAANPAMPNRGGGGMPPSADPTNFGGGGPRGDPSGYDMRFQNSNAGLPYPPGGDMPPGTNPSLQNNTSRASMNPALVQQMPMMPGGAGPPRPPQSGTPSTRNEFLDSVFAAVCC